MSSCQGLIWILLELGFPSRVLVELVRFPVSSLRACRRQKLQKHEPPRPQGANRALQWKWCLSGCNVFSFFHLFVLIRSSLSFPSHPSFPPFLSYLSFFPILFSCFLLLSMFPSFSLSLTLWVFALLSYFSLFLPLSLSLFAFCF